MKKKVAKKKAKIKKKPSLAERLKAAKQSLEKAKKKSVKIGEGLFRECVRQLFKDHPKLEQFSWVEYTPHWNDGDECTFEVHLDSLKINGESDDDAECVHTLEYNYKLLSNKKKSEARIIMELADPNKDRWEADRLKRDLEVIRTRNADEVASKYKIKKSIYDMLASIDDSVYESVFGEGEVIVTRDGIKIENYEHD
jgi:hypothetical protein